MNIALKIANEFGSKQGFLRYLIFGAKNRFGLYRGASSAHLEKVERLVFVCSGNICRSPFGEAVSVKRGFPSVSYGLHCRGGDKAFERTIEYAQRTGYSLENHRSSHISNYEPQESDLLIVMEPAHLQELNQLFPQQKKLLLGMLSPMRTVYLHDPFNTNKYYFDKCLKNIETATTQLIDSLTKSPQQQRES